MGFGKENLVFQSNEVFFVCVDEARGIRPRLSIEVSWGHEDM